MNEREKVIKGLECCSHEEIGDCDNCPYNSSDMHCDIEMMRDALELLKAFEPVPPETENWWDHTYGRCGGCKAPLPAVEGLKSKFCWMCGGAVKWDEVYRRDACRG